MSPVVINLAERRRRKEIEEALARGRVPLTPPNYVPPPPINNDAFAERIMRIKASLEKINALMAELKGNLKEKE